MVDTLAAVIGIIMSYYAMVSLFHVIRQWLFGSSHQVEDE